MSKPLFHRVENPSKIHPIANDATTLDPKNTRNLYKKVSDYDVPGSKKSATDVFNLLRKK